MSMTNQDTSSAITLTLDTAPENNSPVIQAPTQDNSETTEIKELESNFSAKEIEQIDAFCEQIDVTKMLAKLVTCWSPSLMTLTIFLPMIQILSAKVQEKCGRLSAD